jgi:hypothetical protein
MEVTHETPNIRQLEKELGYDAIEMFIEAFALDVELVEDMAHFKPWEDLDIPEHAKRRFEMSKIPLADHMKNRELLEEKKKAQTLLG